MGLVRFFRAPDAGVQGVIAEGVFPRKWTLKPADNRVDLGGYTMSVALRSSFGAWWIRLVHWMGYRPQAPSVAEIPPAPDAPPPEEAVAEPCRFADAAVEKEGRRALLQEELARSFAQTVVAPVPLNATVLSRAETLVSLDGLQQIPSLQSLVQGFVKISGSDDASVDDVVASIQRDPALCIRLLTMANSVVIASEQRVTDLNTAVHLLGVLRVRRLQKAFFTLRDARQLADGLDWRHLWVHALATASLAEELDRELGTKCGPQLYLAGLLHDVGKIALSTVAAETYRSVLVEAWHEKGQLEDLERAYLGIDHREAGWIFALQNKLPEVVVEAVAFHNEPSKAVSHPLEVSLVCVANYLSKEFGLGFSGSRLGERDGDFSDLPAWEIIDKYTAFMPSHEDLEGRLRVFSGTLRGELRNLREIS